MSLLTQAFIVEKYGLRLNSAQLAEVLGVTVPALYNMIGAGTCGVKTYKDGKHRWADYRDVAEYFDEMRKTAT